MARSAPLELRRAQEALQRVEAALHAGQDLAAVEHHAYLANQQANIALQAGQIAQAEKAVADSQQQHDRILMGARMRKVDIRLAQAQRATADAERSRVATEQARMDAEKARAESERARKLAEERLLAAQKAGDRASIAAAEADKLQAKLAELKAQQTDRGMVLTLGDVLFDSGRTELKSGAMQTIDRLAGLIRENPQRKLAVEGCTDSVTAGRFGPLVGL